MELSPLEIAAAFAEYKVITETLKHCKDNKAKAAKMLGIDRKTLYNKIVKYNRLFAKKQEAA